MKNISVFLLLAALLACGCHSAMKEAPGSCCARTPATVAAVGMDVPGPANTSIYQLPGVWADQDDRNLPLRALGGRVQLVAMVYTNCGYTCPRLVDEMKSIRRALPDSIRDRVGCVLVTLDPTRDTPARLRQYAQQKQLYGQWELLHGNEEQVRELSMVLNVRYRDLGNGNFSHTANITVLDREGRIVRSLADAAPAGDAISLIDRLAGDLKK